MEHQLLEGRRQHPEVEQLGLRQIQMPDARHHLGEDVEVEAPGDGDVANGDLDSDGVRLGVLGPE